MCHLKSSFEHSLTVKIGKDIRELKGNPNFHGILNWILQILHYSTQEWTKMFPNHKVPGEEKKYGIVT